ncbi:LmeA family phospholipid-binding protein [Spirulina major]|uniref:LmeA family phospholipid-binding protein n=1 Tax=Spirulina major TaxID=270636 RepID=UPI00093355DF|nr:DUF2993 domain-containing protein [Spirulina major]
MEFLTVLLAGLIAGIAPTGFILDTVIERQLQNRLPGSDEIVVRIDNTPSYQVLGGNVDRIRLATEGLQLRPYLRVREFDLETDPVSVNLKQLQQGGNPRQSLRSPLTLGTRLVLDEADINAALAAPEFRERLQGLVTRLSGSLPGNQTYTLQALTVDFQASGRMAIAATVQSPTATLLVEFAAGLAVIDGTQVEFTDPTISLNGGRLSPFVEAIVEENLQNRINLESLDPQGILARILQLEVESETLTLAGVVRISPQ